jgi:hypothetical protein
MQIDMVELRKGYYIIFPKQNEAGTLSWKAEYIGGVLCGYFKSYSTDGRLYWEGYYLKRVLEGEAIFY